MIPLNTEEVLLGKTYFSLGRLHVVLCVTLRDVKGRVRSETSSGRIQDVSLTIIRKMVFSRIFTIFPDSNCISDIVLPNNLKPGTSYFGPIMARDLSTKTGPLRVVLRTLCTG